MKAKTRVYQAFAVPLFCWFLSACGANSPEAIRQAKLKHPRSRFSITHSRGTLQFIQVRTRGDGDCALHSIERTRREFVALMRTGISDPEVRRMIQRDLLSSGFPLQGVQQDYSLEDYQRYVNERLTRRSEHLSFDQQDSLRGVPDLTSPSLPVERQGTLSAAARVYGINIRVWMRVENHPEQIQLTAKYIEPHAIASYDLLYSRGFRSSGSGHFERLVDADDGEALNRALDREP